MNPIQSAPSAPKQTPNASSSALLHETLSPQHLPTGLMNSLSREEQKAFLDSLDPADATKVKETWAHWARTSQLPPDLAWRTWLILGGRGSGKTRAAAEWVRHMIENNICNRMALVGPTFADVRDVMIEGNSGLMAINSYGARPKFEVSRRRIIWPNGGMALVFSAEDPDSMRGPQFDGAWGDEFAAWSHPDAVLDILRPALRFGEDPKLVLSTTPRPIPALKALLADKTCVATRSATRDNARNLSKGFVEDLSDRWQGSIWARQELDGEIIEDPRGALWTRADVAAARSQTDDWQVDRIVVAVDPPVSVGPKADTCGIIVAGAGGEGPARKAVILADYSLQGATPHEWSNAVARAYAQFNANVIVAEGNQGGEMVRAMLALASPQAAIRMVHASNGKRARAEPVVILYNQGRVRHAAHFRDLEDQMCSFGAADFTGSPDRVDALVYALTDLVLNAASPPTARSL